MTTLQTSLGLFQCAVCGYEKSFAIGTSKDKLWRLDGNECCGKWKLYYTEELEVFNILTEIHSDLPFDKRIVLLNYQLQDLEIELNEITKPGSEDHSLIKMYFTQVATSLYEIKKLLKKENEKNET